MLVVDDYLHLATSIADPTVGDAILDRLVHSAHKLQLRGDSLRKRGTKAA